MPRSLLLVAVLLLVAGTSTYLFGRSEPTLRVSIVESGSGIPTAARVRVTDLAGHAGPLPDEAIGVMYGMWDHADGFAYQPDSSFYVDGRFELALEPGTYVLSVSKGNEFIAMRDTIRLEGGIEEREVRLERWIDTAGMGWYSADDHIHVRRSPREDPLLAKWIAAEDVRVGNMLRMGDFWATYYSQHAFGEAGVYRENDRLLVSGQEDPRTPELGHVIGLGASKFVRFRDRYYLYDLVLDSLRTLGGVAGYAHQAETFHGYRGLTLDGLREKVDVIEVLQFCAPGGPLITDHYYFMLNLGFRVTATAGSDFPWCGKPHDGSDEVPVHSNAQIGNARFYTYVGDSLSYDSWIDGVRAGRTFASTGPVIFFDVDGRLPGSTIDVVPGERVNIRAVARGHGEQVPLERLDIVVHGEVVESTVSGEPGQSSEELGIELAIEPEHGMWIAARVIAGPMQAAHTTPVYVTLSGGGFYKPDAMEELLQKSESYLAEIEAALDHGHEHVEHQIWRHKDGLMERIEAARQVVDELRDARR